MDSDLTVTGIQRDAAAALVKRQEAARAERQIVKQQEEKSATADKTTVRTDTISLAANNRVQMYYDRDVNRVIVQVVDGQSQQVLRQIPAEEAVDFIRNFEEYVGLIVNGRV